MTYQDIITIEPGKRGGRPCIRHMRIAVSDVLGWLAAGMTHADILGEYPGIDRGRHPRVPRLRGGSRAARSCCCEIKLLFDENLSA